MIGSNLLKAITHNKMEASWEIGSMKVVKPDAMKNKVMKKFNITMKNKIPKKFDNPDMMKVMLVSEKDCFMDMARLSQASAKDTRRFAGPMFLGNGAQAVCGASVHCV